jgi:hypothetical protein
MKESQMSLSQKIRDELMEMVTEVAGAYNDLIPGVTTEEQIEPVLVVIQEALDSTVEKLMNLIDWTADPVLPEAKPSASRLLPQPDPIPAPVAAPVAQPQPPLPATLPSEAQKSLSEVAGLGDDFSTGSEEGNHLGLTLEQERRIQQGKPANPARPHVVIDYTGSKEYPTKKHFREAATAVPHTRVDAPPAAAPRAAVNPDLEEANDDHPKV